MTSYQAKAVRIIEPIPTMDLQAGGQIIDLQPLPTEHVLTRKYRRNGKLQSCEPCRKSKLKCDHVTPTCRRCVRRRCGDQCVYHPNPLAQSRRTTKAALPTPSTSVNDENTPNTIPSVQAPTVESPVAFGPGLPQPRSIEGAAHHRAASAPPHRTHQYEAVRMDPGFLGATNFTSIFTENLSHLGFASADLEAAELQKVTISEDRIRRGCRLLSFLKDRTMINQFATRYFDICDGGGIMVVQTAMREWLRMLWIHHGDALESQDPDKIRRLCESLWCNTQSPLAFNETTLPMQWIQSATGPGIRWEVIGLIATTVGQCANTLDPTDQFLKDHNVSRPTLPRRMSEVGSACLMFCRSCETLDDLFIWLLMENTSLTSTLKGDGSYALYRESGELINSVVALGLHVDVNLGKKKVPFFLGEMRKRVLVQAYSVEISISSFLGRPPRLSYRYCNLEGPLDLTEAQVFLERDEEIVRTLATLDDRGFNTAGNIHRTTWIKTWLGFAPRREDVLDLALGQYTREETLQRAGIIQAKSEEYWESLPEFIRKIKDGAMDTRRRKPMETLLRDIIRQGFRANELLLQRVLIRKTGASSEKLVHTARLMFNDVLRTSRRHDLGALFQNDIAYLLASQGLRSAAVIAAELLKQEQLPTYLKEPLLPRSRTIQELSVFAARLAEVDPSDGAFGICDQGRKVITRILDKILSPPSNADPVDAFHQTQVQHDQQQTLGHADLDAFMNEAAQASAWRVPDATDTITMGDPSFGIEAPFLGHDNEFMQWLENMNWESPIP